MVAERGDDEVLRLRQLLRDVVLNVLSQNSQGSALARSLEIKGKKALTLAVTSILTFEASLGGVPERTLFSQASQGGSEPAGDEKMASMLVDD